MKRNKFAIVLSAVLLNAMALGGCVSLSPESAFDDVADQVEDRTGKKIVWDSDSTDDQEAREHISDLLERRLSPSRAVQVALLNNKGLHATYANLGMAQADLVQAGLLTNPVLDGEVLWPYRPEAAAANIVLGVVFNFIELFWRRYKEAVAKSALEEVKIMVSGAVIDHAADTNRAFIDYVAARQDATLLARVVKSARATVAAAKAIRVAGNSTPLDFEQQQNVLTNAKLALAAAQARVASTREALNVLMGLSGDDSDEWSAPSKLPSSKSRLTGISDIEHEAIESSLELAALRQKIITLGYKYQLVRRQSLIPDIGLGAQLELLNDGEREIGPRFDVTLPLFDRGEARKARNIMEIRQAQDKYWAMGIRVRSAARLARAALLTTRKTVNYYQKAVLPQQARLLAATQRQYNAMQEDIYFLIRIKRNEIQAREGYIAAMSAYLKARVDIQQLLSGRLPGGGGGSVVAMAASAGGGGQGGH